MSPGGVHVGHLYGGWRSATPFSFCGRLPGHRERHHQLKQLQIVSEAPSAPKGPKEKARSTTMAASKAMAARSAVDDDDAKETVAGSGSGAVAESQGSASSADTVLCLETPDATNGSPGCSGSPYFAEHHPPSPALKVQRLGPHGPALEANPHGVSKSNANQLHSVIEQWYPLQTGKL